MEHASKIRPIMNISGMPITICMPKERFIIVVKSWRVIISLTKRWIKTRIMKVIPER